MNLDTLIPGIAPNDDSPGRQRSEARAAKLRERLGVEPKRKLPGNIAGILYGDSLSSRTRARGRYIDNKVRAHFGLDPIPEANKLERPAETPKLRRARPGYFYTNKNRSALR